MLRRLNFMALLLALFATVSINAQVTTSGISGVVTDNNETLVGATIQAVHTPSGTKYHAVSNLDGRYTIQGMRTGGPYSILVTYVGYEDKVVNDVYLQLGQPFDLNVNMTQSNHTLNDVVVVGNTTQQHAGAAHNFTSAKIEQSATVDRNIFDVVKNMPLANYTKSGGMSFAGTTFRYNSFQIDGATNNDVFGLAFNGTNGGQANANPISMDAIQEIQVVVAPFDVRQSGFTGGGINAVTKQGTNDFHATFFTYYNNQDFYGKYNAAQDYIKSPLSKQHKTTIGGNISGPIVKDKLFFFANFEYQNKSYPSSYYPGVSKDYLSEATAQMMADRYYELTGIRETWGPRNVDTRNIEFLGRIDWNINDSHKLALRYQHGDSYDDGYSAGYTSYYFNNSSYRFNNITNSFVAELNSSFGNQYFNELRLSYNRVRDNRDVPYMGPLFWIKNLPNDYLPTEEGYRSNISVNLGTHYVSGANRLDQDNFLLEDNFTWYKGNHNITFGTHNEFFLLKNLFVQYATGEWVYNSLDEFANDKPSNFYFRCIDPERTGGDLLWAPTIKAGQFGFYAQDKWNVNPNFELTYGLRLDIPVMFNKPTANPEMNEYYESKAIQARIGEMPTTKLMVSPRLGFRWFTDDDHKTLIRGGLGIFTGRVPFVWLSNAFGNNGVEQIGTTISNAADIPPVTNNTADLVEYLSKGSKFRMDIATVEKKFRFPQVLRANLAWEQRFAGNWKFTLEGLYSKTFNQVFFNNLAINQSGAVFAVEGVEASQAPFYTSDNKCANLINLENTNKGYTYSISGTIEKRFDFGLNVLASYTFGHAKSVFDGTASIALSSWKASQAVDTRRPKLSYSNFDQPHRVLVSLDYTSPRYLNGWMQTTIGVTYNGYSGQRYSLCMNESPSSGYNGDGTRGNSLLYIPTTDELARMDFADLYARVDGVNTLIMTGDEQRAKFEDFIVHNSYAKKHRGQYSERNSCLAPFEHQIDLHFAQSIYALKERGSKIMLTLDILNFANMLNKKWGATYSSSTSVTPLNNTALVNKGNGMYVARYTWNGYTEPSKYDIGSRWHMQIGVKLIF